ncbi:hypothetical protein ACYX7E_07550 [Luteimonas sp. RIT-PG2_3]
MTLLAAADVDVCICDPNCHTLPMDGPVTKLTSEQRAALRKNISDWARNEMAMSRYSRLQVNMAMRQSVGWLGNRLSGAAITFTPAQLRQFAQILDVSIPKAVSDCAELLRTAGRSSSGARRRLPPIDVDALRNAGSAQLEIDLLLGTAAHGRPQRSRDLDWTLRRFGLGVDRPETLEEIGISAGVTRERVRQVEAKMLQLASIAAEGHSLPMLASVYQRVVESVGLPWEAVERELRPFLGTVPLREAIRFLEEVQTPTEKVGMDRASIYGLGNTLRVVATSADDLRFTSQVSSAARKIFSFAGAALVNDIRALLETTRKKPVALRDLVRTLGALPELEWLDDHHRWCWFNTPELSALLRRAALILTAARAPVDMETLYAGLVREGRRDFDSHAADVTDPVPPAHVVHAILKRHRDFRRTAANAFTYVAAFDPSGDVEPAIRLILQRLEELGGAATRAELYELENHPDHPIPRNSFANYLYCAGRIERIGPGAWAIRGRPIDEVRRREVLARSLHASTTSTRPSQLRPAGPYWKVVLRLTEAARRNRLMAFPSAAIPYGASGRYQLPDGHEVTLRQDHHGTRMTRLGPAIKALLEDAAVIAVRFEFDGNEHTLQVHAQYE